MYTVFSFLVTLLALVMTANAVPTSAPSPINMAPLAPFAPVGPVAGNNNDDYSGDLSPECAPALLALQACLSTTNKDCVDSIDTCITGVDTSDSSVCGSMETLCHVYSCCVPCADVGRKMVECESHARGCDITCPITTEETIASGSPVDSPVQAPSTGKSGSSGISPSYWMMQIWIMSVSYGLFVRN